MTAGPCHLVEILLPKQSGNGKPVGKEWFEGLLEELTDKFGGATSFVRSPGKGLWLAARAGRVLHRRTEVFCIRSFGLRAAEGACGVIQIRPRLTNCGVDFLFLSLLFFPNGRRASSAHCAAFHFQRLHFDQRQQAPRHRWLFALRWPHKSGQGLAPRFQPKPAMEEADF